MESFCPHWRRSDAHVILNGAAWYRVNKNAKVFVNVHNIRDEEYVASRHPHGPRAGQPLTAMVGIEASF